MTSDPEQPRPSATEPLVDRIFGDALDRDPADRAAFLDDACAGDAVLRGEVASLLDAHGNADAVLGAPLTAADQDPLVGRTIGPYTVERRLGAGGMGVVYEGARHGADFDQRVAIKLIRAGGVAPEDVLTRFRLERRVLARLEHPGIARLVDGGTSDDGQPYLVMELVDGEPIDAYCDARRLGVPARLQLIRAVCAAVNHAHRNLVVHRDLKPANILVRDTEDGPDVKLLDFGIAKLIEDDEESHATLTVERRLTPAYASPEQIRGDPVSTATDVYALGVILYELLTGQAPYAPDRPLEAAIVTGTPTRPSVAVTDDAATARSSEPGPLRRLLRGDLEQVVLMALRKEPERRYSSADQLADDLDAYLDGRPVRARPDALGYRVTRFVQRNRIGVAAAAVLVAALAGAAVVSTTSYFRAESARTRAEAVSTFLTEMLSSIDPDYARGRDTSVLRQMLGEASGRVDAALADAPGSAAELHLAIGRVYGALAEDEDALRHFERAAEVRDGLGDTLGAAEAELAAAALLSKRNRYAEAEPRLRAVLALRESELGPVDPAVAEVLSRLALQLNETGAYDEAETLYRRALSIRRAADPPDDAALAQLLGWYGLHVHWQNRHDEARPMLEEALALSRRVHGDSPRLLENLGNLASFHVRTESIDAATELYVEGLELCAANLPADHPTRLSLLSNYANALQRLERFDESEQYFREALEQQTSFYGREHMTVGTTTNNLAGLLENVGRDEEAMALFAEAAAIYAAVFGPDHYWVSISLFNKARMLAQLGQCDEARTEIREVTRIRVLHDAPEWQRIEVDVVEATCLAQDGRYAEASALLESVLLVHAARFGEDHRMIRQLRATAAEYRARVQLEVWLGSS